MNKSFSYYLKQKRAERELTQKEMADLCKISRSYIAVLESGQGNRNPLPEILKTIAKVLRVSESEVFKEAGYFEQPVRKERSMTGVMSQLRQLLPIEVPIYNFSTNQIEGTSYVQRDEYHDNMVGYHISNPLVHNGINRSDAWVQFPVIRDGDIVFICNDLRPSDADIVLQNMEGKMHFCRFQDAGDTPVLGVIQTLMKKLL